MKHCDVIGCNNPSTWSIRKGTISYVRICDVHKRNAINWDFLGQNVANQFCNPKYIQEEVKK